MSRFATGVTVITAAGPGGPVGLTANAVTSLSLDPLLLLVCFDNNARTLPIIRDGGHFGVNVLSADQEHLARLFASKLPENEKFAGVPHHLNDGIPAIDGVIAFVACRLTQLIPGGDHQIGIGAVLAVEAREGEPLVFYRGRFRRLAP
jgi:3-hydroxy-9,10-secoandrosta-1,3,5(10)-triene-9,17-dione monooxygenase reductase component